MRSGRDGFSLVEIVIAIGVIAFALVALVSLFGVGLAASRQAADDTTLASMTWYVAGDLRANRPDTAGLYHFDLDGLPLPAQADAHYACEIELKDDFTEEKIADISGKLRRASLRFSWPASLPAEKRPNSNTVHVTYMLR